MKPSQIFSILDLAMTARKNGDKLNPLFEGPPGIGKSEIVQQWCKARGLAFVDIRAAYFEAPDMIGFPLLKEVNGRSRTLNALPEIWPTDMESSGVILLEEPNRGTTSVMNTMMQLLTDRKIHLYDLPPGWIIVGCINPEAELYDTSTMDPALKNRFQLYTVDYDQDSFLKFMANNDWDQRVQTFVRGHFWNFQTPENVANNAGAKYVSPRSLSALNAALRAGLTEHDELIQMTVLESILGKTYGIQFFNFISKERPVYVIDLEENYEASIARLRMFSRPEDYKNGHISLFVEDVKRNHERVTDDMLAAICTAVPSDQSVLLLRELGFLRNLKANELYDKMCKDYPAVKKYLQKNLKSK